MERPTKEVLKLVPLFSKFDDESLTKLESFIEEKPYKEGDILFQENSLGDTFFIIKKGSVEIYKESGDGKERVVLAMRRSGDFFGEMALLENSPRFATARVTADSQILELSKAAFISLLYEVPIVAFEIMGVLASRLRQADMQTIKELKAKNSSLEDMSAQLKESNRRLSRTKEFLERIIKVSPDIVVVTDSEGKIYIFNQAARDIYGYGYEEVRQQSVACLHSPNCPDEALKEIEQCLKENDTFSGEIVDVRKDGNEFINYVTACNINNTEGKVIGVLYLGKDITESKELERQTQSLVRLAARGQMAAEVAHELNNYISILSGNLELLPKDMHANKTEGVEKKLVSMKTAIDRMTVFTNGLMSHAQPKYEFCDVDLNRFLEAELAFLRPQNRFRNIEISINLDEKIGSIAVDPVGLQQILYNLVNNAADAINDADIRDGVVSVSTELSPEDDTVIISVTDNGSGMTEQEKEKAFRKSFTTKTDGHGFGLLTVNSIVRVHFGKVSVESEPGKGTRFDITLPLKQKPPSKSVAQERSSQLQKSDHNT